MIPSIEDIKKKMNPGFKIGASFVDMGHPLDPERVYKQFMESYSVYYNLTRFDGSAGAVDASGAGAESEARSFSEGGDRDFIAEAVFDSKGEQYFLIKSAKIAETHTAEYVYFVREDELKADRLKALDEKAWTEGVAHAKPAADHKNTDVVLIIISKSITGEARELVKSLKHSKVYKMAMHGFSNYRLVAVETETGVAYFNKQARILKRLVGNILTEEKERVK